MHQTSTYSLDDWLAETGQIVPDADSQRWVSYNLDDLYPEWQNRAHCSGVGVDYYFGDDDQQMMSIGERRRASKLCEVCPVFKECLTWALTVREEYGIWAGTSGMIRRRIFKMVDNGEITVPEVVEDFRHGRGDTYRLGANAGQAQGPYALRPAAIGDGEDDLRAEARGEAAI